MIHEFKTVKELREYLKDDKIILAKKDFVFSVGKYAEHYSTDDIFIGHSNRMVLDGYCTYKYKVSRDIFIKAIETIEEIEMENTNVVTNASAGTTSPHKHKELIEKWVKDTNQKVWFRLVGNTKWNLINRKPSWSSDLEYLVQENDPNIPEIPKYKEITVNDVCGIKVLNVEWLKENNIVVNTVSKKTGLPTFNLYFTNFTNPENLIFFDSRELACEFLESVEGNDTYTIS